MEFLNSHQSFINFLDTNPDINDLVKRLKDIISRPSQQTTCFTLLATEEGRSVKNASTSLRDTAAFIQTMAKNRESLYLSNNLSSWKIVNVINEEVGCLTTILQTDLYDAKSLAQMTRKMRHHSIYKLGGKKPGSDELKMHDRPVVWVEEKPLVSVCSEFIAKLCQISMII